MGGCFWIICVVVDSLYSCRHHHSLTLFHLAIIPWIIKRKPENTRRRPSFSPVIFLLTLMILCSILFFMNLNKLRVVWRNYNELIVSLCRVFFISSFCLASRKDEKALGESKVLYCMLDPGSQFGTEHCRSGSYILYFYEIVNLPLGFDSNGTGEKSLFLQTKFVWFHWDPNSSGGNANRWHVSPLASNMYWPR